MGVNFEYYRVFYYVAKYQSISVAAKFLYLTQPTVSHYIHNLEKQLNATLFVRTSRGVTMTREAEVLYNNVSQAMEHIQAAENKLHNYLNIEHGSIQVVATETSYLGCVLPVIKDFHKKHPSIFLKISIDYTPHAIQKLKAGLVDFVVVTDPLDRLAETYDVFPLKSFQDIVVGGPRFEFLASAPQSLKTLAKYSCIRTGIPDVDDAYTQKLIPYFLNDNLNQNNSLSIENYTFQRQLLLENTGIGVLPDILVSKELASKQLFSIPVDVEIPRRNINLICENSQPISAASRMFIQVLKSAFSRK